MLDRFLTSRMANSYYYSILIETSHFAINGRFDFYNIDDWVNIKQKTRKEQKALRKQKDKFLKTTFPDFYDIHYSLENNPVAYIFNVLDFVFKGCPSRLIQQPWVPSVIKNFWNRLLVFTKKVSKLLKSILYINKLTDVCKMFILPLVPPLLIAFVIYFVPSIIKYIKKDSPHLSNATSTTKPLDNPVKMDKTKAK